MWSRFQIGSKRPLAKRSARMFCAASLPRKWSMRKTCSSRRTWWIRWLSCLALARSVPNGFSMITRERSIRSAAPSRWMTSVAAAGGTRGSGAGGPPRPARLRPARPRRPTPPAPGRVRHVAEPARELVPVLLAEGMAGELAAGLARELAEFGVVDLLHRDADDPEVRHQIRLEEPQQAREQLPSRQVPGGSEDDDHMWRKRQGGSLARITYPAVARVRRGSDQAGRDLDRRCRVRWQRPSSPPRPRSQSR